jgi:hypothetical protein
MQLYFSSAQHLPVLRRYGIRKGIFLLLIAIIKYTCGKTAFKRVATEGAS